MKWFEEKYRHHLCDMHIEDWDERFLSQFSPEKYFENLRLAHVNAPMIYLQSHVGHCYYPTKAGHIHRAFVERPDAMRRLIDLCHGDGMAVVGYYSLSYNTYEYDRHPEWRMIDAEGLNPRARGGRYGHCCPNNPEYRAFVAEQIREMAEYCHVEGMFYDMPFWNVTCYCPSCRARWEKEVGGEMPTKNDPRDPRWCTLMDKAEEWMGDFCRFVRAETEKVMPWIESVEYNYAAAMISDNWTSGTCEEVGDACDFANGDLYGGIRVQTAACKYYDAASRYRPFEYMTTRCANLSKHTVTYSQDQLELLTMINVAHHGSTLIIDAIDPVGTLDERVYRKIGKAFAAAEPYEPYFDGKLLSEAGVLYMPRNKADREKRGVTGCKASVGALNSLGSMHVPCSVVTRRQMDSLAEYPMVIAPLVDFLRPDETQKLIEYVREGGCLYFSGAEESTLLKTLIGGTRVGYTVPTRTYIAPVSGQEKLFEDYNAAYPLPVDMALPMVEGVSPENILATITLPFTARSEQRFASIHSDPPGVPTEYPAVVYAEFGKGKVIWSASPMENESIRDYRLTFTNLLRLFNSEQLVRTDAPERVEMLLHRAGDALRLGAFQLSEDERIEKVYPFQVEVRSDRPRKVRSLPDGAEIASTYADGFVRFTVEDLRIYRLFELV